MSKFFLMNVAKSSNNLSKDLPRIRLFQSTSILYEIEKFSFLAEFSHDEKAFSLWLILEEKLIAASTKHSENIGML